MLQCEIITYNFLRAKSSQLLPSSWQQHRHCHARDTRNTTEHPAHTRKPKLTARIWLHQKTDGQDLTNRSNRRPRSDQMIIILPVKSLLIGRSGTAPRGRKDRVRPSWIWIFPANVPPIQKVRSRWKVVHLSFERLFTYTPNVQLVDEKLFIGVWLVWTETNRAPTWMRNASIHPHPVPSHLLAYVYPLASFMTYLLAHVHTIFNLFWR
jgi:hypothetical protein